MEMQTGTPSAGPSKSNNKLLIIIIVVVLALIIFGWLATFVIGKVVGFGVRKAFEGATGVSVEDSGDGGTITLKGDGGTIEIGGGGSSAKEQKLPKDFPSYFPIMRGAKLTGTTLFSGQDGTSYTLSWESSASVDAATNFYRDELSKNGWSVSTESSADETTTFIVQHGDETDPDATGWVTASADQGKTIISVILSVTKR